MDKYTFYDSLKKYKKNAIKHAADYGQGFYQKIDKYYPDGSARYFYTKAAWDAYLEEQRRNAYEKQQKDLKEKEKAADEAKKSTGAKATADIEANERTKWEQEQKAKPVTKAEPKKEAKPTYNSEKDAKEAEERNKWEEEQKKKLEETWKKKTYNVKKEMQNLADAFERNRELPNVAPDNVLAMVKGQTEQTVNDLIESGITDPKDISKTLEEKKNEFMSFLTEKISPDLENFFVDKINQLKDGKTVQEITEDEGKKYIDEFFEKNRDTVDKIKKEYETIYGVVERFNDEDYSGMAMTTLYEVYKHELKEKLKGKIKEFFSPITETIKEYDRSGPPEWLMSLVQNVLEFFAGSDDEEEPTYSNAIDPREYRLKEAKRKERITNLEQKIYAEKVSANGKKIEEEYRQKEKERKKSKAQKILSEEIVKGLKYAKSKI